jgi:hypothetical protein
VCDSIGCHTLKPNSPAEADIKNIDNDIHNEFSSTNPSKENKISFNHKTDFDSLKIENYIIQEDSIINNSNSSEDKGSNNIPKEKNTIQKNSASLGPEYFQRVTLIFVT